MPIYISRSHPTPSIPEDRIVSVKCLIVTTLLVFCAICLTVALVTDSFSVKVNDNIEGPTPAIEKMDTISFNLEDTLFRDLSPDAKDRYDIVRNTSTPVDVPTASLHFQANIAVPEPSRVLIKFLSNDHVIFALFTFQAAFWRPTFRTTHPSPAGLLAFFVPNNSTSLCFFLYILVGT